MAEGIVVSTVVWHCARSGHLEILLLGCVPFMLFFPVLLALPTLGQLEGSLEGYGICRVCVEVGHAFFWSADSVPAGHSHHWPQTVSYYSHTNLSLVAHLMQKPTSHLCSLSFNGCCLLPIYDSDSAPQRSLNYKTFCH